MNAKTMEGLAGARTNMNLLNTPMRVFKDARRRGDMATMERAMGYVGEFADKAKEYQTKAEKGMEEDAKEAREKANVEQEKVIEKLQEEREEIEERIEESKEADTIEVSEEGKVLLEENTGLSDSDLESDVPKEIKTDMVKKPVIYTKTGEVSQSGLGAGVSVSI